MQGATQHPWVLPLKADSHALLSWTSCSHIPVSGLYQHRSWGLALRNVHRAAK